MTPRDVTLALRAGFWPRLKEVGFESRTDRAAWRYTNNSVDVIETWAVGSSADACGCTTASFSAMAGSIPAFLPDPSPMKDGKPRPHYWDCALKVHLMKTLEQPWFTPFAKPPNPNVPQSLLVHRKALQTVLRKDRHDRPDIWFVLEDGSNLADVVDDLWRVTETVGLAALDRMHDPCQTIEIVEGRELELKPDSPIGDRVLDYARQACHEQQLLLARP